MIPGILGKKIGMTHLFQEDGRMVPVTVIQAGPVYVTQVKTLEKDGYQAVQIGFDEISDKHLIFPKFGHLKKAGVHKNLRTLKEFRVEELEGLEAGQEFNVDLFAEGEKVRVIANAKGRGFQGRVKRYHMAGQHMSHGFMTHRRTLSSGATGPQRVFKGTKKPGRMGGHTVTQLGLKIVKVDTERNLVLVDGSVPGANGSLVIIKKSGR